MVSRDGHFDVAHAQEGVAQGVSAERAAWLWPNSQKDVFGRRPGREQLQEWPCVLIQFPAVAAGEHAVGVTFF